LAGGRRVQRAHGGAVDLATLLEALAAHPGEGGHPLAVLGHRARVVVRPQPEVERGVGTGGHAAAARGEEDAGAGKRDGDVLALPAKWRGQGHVTWSSRPGTVSR